MEKLIKDGMVAVLVSQGYGAGWSTWNNGHPEIVFDPVLAQMVLDEVEYQQMVEYCEKRYPDCYLGGLQQLVVEWLMIGTNFRIDEYDGYESIEILGDIDWLVA